VQQRNLHRVVAAFKAQIEAFVRHLTGLKHGSAHLSTNFLYQLVVISSSFATNGSQ
jgi:hypothetical protein